MRTVVALGLLVALFLTATSAHASTTCTMVPDPVSISSGQQYTITATDGEPLEYYEVIISQKHDGVQDEGRDWLGQADSSGIVTATLTAYPWVDGDNSGLLVSDASVNVSRYRTGGGPGGGASTIARCSFTVVN